jgi:hypothetical protein
MNQTAQIAIVEHTASNSIGPGDIPSGNSNHHHLKKRTMKHSWGHSGMG